MIYWNDSNENVWFLWMNLKKLLQMYCKNSARPMIFEKQERFDGESQQDFEGNQAWIICKTCKKNFQQSNATCL